MKEKSKNEINYQPEPVQNQEGKIPPEPYA